MGKHGDNKKTRSCHNFIGKRGGMNTWSTGDFEGSETILYDTVLVGT